MVMVWLFASGDHSELRLPPFKDSGPLLLLLNPAIVVDKSPHFSSFWSALHQQVTQKRLSP